MNIKPKMPIFICLRENPFDGDIEAVASFLKESEANDYAIEHGSKYWVVESVLFEKVQNES